MNFSGLEELLKLSNGLTETYKGKSENLFDSLLITTTGKLPPCQMLKASMESIVDSFDFGLVPTA